MIPPSPFVKSIEPVPMEALFDALKTPSFRNVTPKSIVELPEALITPAVLFTKLPCTLIEEFIEALKTSNFQAVDMESSIIFLLGKLYNLQVASVLSVSDLPGNAKYDLFKTNVIHPDMEKGIDDAIKILLKLLPKLK